VLLTITTTHRPATDLGYLLHKNPGTAHTFDLSVGKSHVFYPEEQKSAALSLCSSTSTPSPWPEPVAAPACAST